MLFVCFRFQKIAQHECTSLVERFQADFQEAACAAGQIQAPEARSRSPALLPATNDLPAGTVPIV